jgi:MFS transporter, PPP family, 3-phenylpropionic acid transporter
MSQAHDLTSVILCQVLIEGIASPIWSGMDAATQRLLEVTKGGTTEYGNTRAFGAVGWGTCAWIFGFLFDKFSQDICFGLFAVTFLPAILLSLIVPLEKREASSTGRVSALLGLLKPSVLRMVVTMVIIAILLQIVDVYRFPFLRSIGASNNLLGASLAVTAVSEAPFFFVTSAILARISLRASLCIVLSTYAARYVYYSLLGQEPLVDPSWTLPAELLHGLTFALGWAACTQYVAALLPPELANTAQGLLAAIQWGLGSAVGSATAGLTIKQLGFRTMWRVYAALACFGWVLVAFAADPKDPKRRLSSEAEKKPASQVLEEPEEDKDSESEKEEREEDEEEKILQ